MSSEEFENELKRLNRRINRGGRSEDLHSIYFERGELFEKEKRYKEAIWDYDEAINLSMRTSKYYFRRGMCQKKLKDLKNAIKSFSRAIRYDREVWMYYWFRAMTHAENNDLYKSDSDVKFLKRYGGNISDFYITRSKLHERMGVNAKEKTENYLLAISDLTNLIKYEKEKGDDCDNEMIAKVLFQRSKLYYSRKSLGYGTDDFNKSVNNLCESINMTSNSSKIAEMLSERIQDYCTRVLNYGRFHYYFYEEKKKRVAELLLLLYEYRYEPKALETLRLKRTRDWIEGWLSNRGYTRYQSLPFVPETRLFEFVFILRFVKCINEKFSKKFKKMENLVKQKYPTIFNDHGWKVLEYYVTMEYCMNNIITNKKFKYSIPKLLKDFYFQAITQFPDIDIFSKFEKYFKENELEDHEERIELISESLSSRRNARDTSNKTQVITISYDNGSSISIPKYLTNGFNSEEYLKKYTKDIDPSIVKKFFFGIDLSATEIVEYGIQLVKLCDLLKLHSHLFVLCKQISDSNKFGTKNLLKVFIKCIESLEDSWGGNDSDSEQIENNNNNNNSNFKMMLDEVDSQDVLDSTNGLNDNKVVFGSCFTLSTFNALKGKIEELEKSKTFTRVLYRLGDYLSKMKECQSDPIENHPQLHLQDYNSSSTTLRSVFMGTMKQLFYSRDSSFNIILKIRNTGEEMKVHKEILILRSEFFFRMFKFPGLESSQDQVVDIEYLSFQCMEYILEMIYLGRSEKINSNSTSLSTLFNLLVHFEMFGEDHLKFNVIRLINKKMSMGFEESDQEEKHHEIDSFNKISLRILEIGHFLGNLPNELSHLFLESWARFKCFKKMNEDWVIQNLKKYVEYSVQMNKLVDEKNEENKRLKELGRKKDEENLELKEKIRKLEKRKRRGEEEEEDDDDDNQNQDGRRKKRRRIT